MNQMGKALTSLRDEFFLPNWELGARQLGGWQPERNRLLYLPRQTELRARFEPRLK